MPIFWIPWVSFQPSSFVFMYITYIYIYDHEQFALNDRIWQWHGDLIIDSHHVKYFKKSTFCSEFISIFMALNKARIFIHNISSINWMVFVTETQCECYTARTGSLNIIPVNRTSGVTFCCRLITAETRVWSRSISYVFYGGNITLEEIYIWKLQFLFSIAIPQCSILTSY
jgi:hypothetical protein